MLQNQSDSLAIEKLHCMRRNYTGIVDDAWAFWRLYEYNSNAFSRDRLSFAGLGYPVLPQVGIGLDYFDRDLVKRPQLDQAKAFCAHRMRNITELIGLLETGTPVPEELKAYFEINWVAGDAIDDSTPVSKPTRTVRLSRLDVTTDTYTQLIISAARGKNHQNRGYLTKNAMDRSNEWYPGRVYYEVDPETGFRELRDDAVEHLDEMFQDVDREALDWIGKSFPDIFQLYEDVKEKRDLIQRDE